MKKLSSIISQFTIIDIVILIFIIGTLLFSVYTIVSNDAGDVETYIFDSQTIKDLPDKYSTLYHKGEIVKAEIKGYNQEGKDISANGTVIWVDVYKGGNTKVEILSNNSNKPIMAAYDADNADIYIKEITLKSTGDKYKNVVDIKIKHQSVSTLKNLVSGIPNGTNYTISTRISVNNVNNNVFQNLSNIMYDDLKKESIRPTFKNSYLQLALVMADDSDIRLASKILGNINGESDTINIRIYNANQEQINAIEDSYDVLSVNRVT